MRNRVQWNQRGSNAPARSSLGPSASSSAAAAMPGRSASSSSFSRSDAAAAATATRTASSSSSHASAHRGVMFDGMDEDEIVARIMKQVRECESSSRRSLRRPKEGIAYDLDKNGSIIVQVPSAVGTSRGDRTHRAGLAATSFSSGSFAGDEPTTTRRRQLYSVDDCRRPVPSYQVEVNTDRVGSFSKTEMDDAFQYLMSGTPRRNKKALEKYEEDRRHNLHLSNDSSRSRRGRSSGGVVPRYLSLAKGATNVEDSDESFVEQYDLVQYEEESVAPRSRRVVPDLLPAAADATISGPTTPRRSVRDVRTTPSRPVAEHALRGKVSPDDNADVKPEVALNQSTSTHSSSSSSSASPLPSSPDQYSKPVSSGNNNVTSSSASVVTVPPTNAQASMLCAMAWMRGDNDTLPRTNESSASASATGAPRYPTGLGGSASEPMGATTIPPTTTTTTSSTLYERLSLPLCRATSTVELAESFHLVQQDSMSEATGVEEMVRRTTTITSHKSYSSTSPQEEEEEEEDVDILRPWGFGWSQRTSSSSGNAKAGTPTVQSRSRSTKSTSSSVLRTIRERGGSSDRDDSSVEDLDEYEDGINDDGDDVSSIVTRDDDKTRRLADHRGRSSFEPSRYHRRRTDGSSLAGTTVTGTTRTSKSTAFRSRRGGGDGSVSECTTLQDPASSQPFGRYPPGCMALVQNVWQGIDRAEQALLGSMSVDDDLWTDLYEDEYDLYSTEMTADRSTASDDASMSTATSSRWTTAERSGLTSTLSADDRSHIVSSRRVGSRTVTGHRNGVKRSPRRSQYDYSNA